MSGSSAAGLLAITQLYLGDLKHGIDSAKKAVDLSMQQSRKAKEMYAQSTLGKLLVYSGAVESARDALGKAMALLRDPSNREIPANCANVRYRFCELLLAEGKHDEASRVSAEGLLLANEQKPGPVFVALLRTAAALAEMARGNLSNLDLAADWLRVARAEFAMGGLMHETIRGELAWAECSSRRGDKKECRAALDHALEIAERGPMRLHMADIHLYRAQHFFLDKEYPWREGKNLNGEFVTNRTAADDLAAAKKLIDDCGYHRRDKELAAAKRAILGT